MASDNDLARENGGGVMEPMTSDYNKLNASQSTVWTFVKPLLAKALHNIATSNSSFRIADLGCATGGNSVAPLSFIAQQLAVETSLEVFLGDLPRNAWSTVVETVTPEALARNRSSSVFVYMVGRTFYECCTPAASLDLSYCLVAVHWMKSYPGDIPGGLYATCPVHNLDPKSLKAWKEAGAKDFAVFTKARHQELRVGGRFIGCMACQKENGDYPWSLVGRVIYDVLLTKVKSADDLAACVLPNCYRTEADIREGFSFKKDDGSPCWELEVCEFRESKDPVRESLERGEISSTEYAKTVIEAFKAVCHPTCLGSLSKTMSESQASRLLEESYTESIGLVASNAARYNLDVSFWYVLAKKL